MNPYTAFGGKEDDGFDDVSMNPFQFYREGFLYLVIFTFKVRHVAKFIHYFNIHPSAFIYRCQPDLVFKLCLDAVGTINIPSKNHGGL
jgi:hypothetical protein